MAAPGSAFIGKVATPEIPRLRQEYTAVCELCGRVVVILYLGGISTTLTNPEEEGILDNWEELREALVGHRCDGGTGTYICRAVDMAHLFERG